MYEMIIDFFVSLYGFFFGYDVSVSDVIDILGNFMLFELKIF